MSDHVNGIRRGSFRLHSLNTDGSGVSWGYITFYRASEFQVLRRSLLNRKKVRVPGGNGLMAYGRINVRGIPDFSKWLEKAK
ncbi:tlde1 domain-containing protein [Mixta theicola]|uniref:tlde1 domain-containing protein n=1 Tax=Mixta theicola TaxID=1458355 RepID=UPI0013FD9F53|nr:tlde1 domain-containing protein [Mixta theicola]